MKKKILTLLGIVAACIIAFSFFNFDNNEKTLAQSMKETKKDHQKIDELMIKLHQKLESEGYPELSPGFSFEERLLTVQVEDKKFVDSHGKNIKALIKNIAKEIKFEDFDVKFEIVGKRDSVNEEDKKLMELSHEVSKLTSDLLVREGYKVKTFFINPTTPNPVIGIKVDGTKEYYNNVKEEIKNLVGDAVSSKTNITFDVKVNRKSENEIRDEKWQPIFQAITEETNKKFEEYRGFAYSFHPKPLQIIIKTDLHKSKWFWNSDKKVEQIESYVNEIIKLKREELSVEEIPYEIIIRSKDNKKLN
ncbi:hypothetical protein [Peribacillus loiseleuriae]|uniref:hypothetical protein n=1 Tax=Peribacillus loiseleuriae TaxID=1679170 RepID=UPI003CFBE6E7